MLKTSHQQECIEPQLCSGIVVNSVSYPDTVTMHPCHQGRHIIHPSTDLTPTVWATHSASTTDTTVGKLGFS